MKTKLLSLFACAIVSSLVHAEVLYWQIEPASGVNTENWNYVKVYGDNIALKSSETGTYIEQIGKLGEGESASSYSSVFASNTASNFYIEIFSDPDGTNKVGWSSPISYDSLTTYIDKVNDFHVANHASYAFQAVPEPTSGLMLLVGMAMLGLRRRKVA